MTQSGSGTPPRIWSPVKQQAADSFLLLMIACFAATVLLVRFFLQLSGYPQVGNSTFHIAHLLWGGLLLIVALVMMLLWANHWVLWVAAAAGGIGVGLFIDEVGKFITQSNDYFFPLAFPIIYAFLLIFVWVYMRVRRSRTRDTRTLLYHALEDLKEVLDNDLDPFEHQELVNELTQVLAQAELPSEKRLAQAILDFVRTNELRLAREPNRIERVWGWTRFVASQWPSQNIMRWLLILGFAVAGASAVIQIGALVAVVSGMADMQMFNSTIIISGNSQYEVNSPELLFIHGLGIFLFGALGAAGAALMLLHRERLGLRLGTLGLVLSLTVVNLLTFYFSQLYAVGAALAQLALLAVAMIYRWRFFLNQ